VRPRRVDDNQREITAALRKIGCSVQPVHTIGRGCPDLLVGYKGINLLLEIKDGAKPESRQRLTPDEIRWHLSWRGQVAVITSVENALRLFSAPITHRTRPLRKAKKAV